MSVHTLSHLPVVRSLSSVHGLEYVADACLPLRHRAGGCEACARACPVAAIAFDQDRLTISDDCVGCGRCVAACPMGALSMPALQRPQGVVHEAVECARIPEALRLPGAWGVPCLGALDVATLVDMQQGLTQALQIVDRGLCAGCVSAANEGLPCAEALEQARDLLESMGVPIACLPRRQSLPLPERLAERPQLQAGRRRFLARLGRSSGRMLASRVSAGVAGAPLWVRPPRRSTARLKLLAACLEMARARGLPMPLGLFRAPQVDERCCDHGICARVCPTGALFQVEVGQAEGDAQAAGAGTGLVGPGQVGQHAGTLELHFDALACIDCGACQRACPEQAMHLEPRMDEGWRTSEVLRRSAMRNCTGCGATFMAGDGVTQCQPCTASQALVRDAFHMFSKRAVMDVREGASRASVPDESIHSASDVSGAGQASMNHPEEEPR